MKHPSALFTLLIFVIILTPAPFSADPRFLAPKDTKFKISLPKHTNFQFFDTRQIFLTPAPHVVNMTNIRYGSVLLKLLQKLPQIVANGTLNGGRVPMSLQFEVPPSATNGCPALSGFTIFWPFKTPLTKISYTIPHYYPQNCGIIPLMSFTFCYD